MAEPQREPTHHVQGAITHDDIRIITVALVSKMWRDGGINSDENNANFQIMSKIDANRNGPILTEQEATKVSEALVLLDAQLNHGEVDIGNAVVTWEDQPRVRELAQLFHKS